MDRRPSLRQLGIAAILLVLGAFLCAYAFVRLGIYDVAASSPHSKPVEWIIHETMINSVRRHAGSAVLPATRAVGEVPRGFCIYDAHCVACHGAAAVAREQWVSGLNPTPPYLLDATSRWKPRELAWIIRNGIKMTGMPAWRDTLSGSQIHDVVAFLEAMRTMPPQTYLRWRSSRLCPAQSSVTGSILGTANAHQTAPRAATIAVR